MEADNRPIGVPAALAGRPSRAPRTYRPDELVRVEIRMPATVAAELFARARDRRQPVSRTASDLLANALDHSQGDAMG